MDERQGHDRAQPRDPSFPDLPGRRPDGPVLAGFVVGAAWALFLAFAFRGAEPPAGTAPLGALFSRLFLALFVGLGHGALLALAGSALERLRCARRHPRPVAIAGALTLGVALRGRRALGRQVPDGRLPPPLRGSLVPHPQSRAAERGDERRRAPLPDRHGSAAAAPGGRDPGRPRALPPLPDRGVAGSPGAARPGRVRRRRGRRARTSGRAPGRARLLPGHPAPRGAAARARRARRGAAPRPSAARPSRRSPRRPASRARTSSS